MTDLRKAAEAVLEAWAWDWSEPRNEALRERIDALRQALAQRKWVGLTQEEVDALLWKLSVGAVDEDVRTIEAKLKEKNGG